jgi:cysteine synthase A
MRLFGTDLRIIPAENGKLIPELFRTMIATAKKLGEEPNSYYTDQFNNTDAIQGYMGIGNELLEQVGPEMAAFCAGVGTAGMLMGVSSALKARGAKTKIVALEPSSSPVLTKGKGGPHRVEGIAAGFRPPHLQDGQYDEVRTVDEQEAARHGSPPRQRRRHFHGNILRIKRGRGLAACTGNRAGEDRGHSRSGQRNEISRWGPLSDLNAE